MTETQSPKLLEMEECRETKPQKSSRSPTENWAAAPWLCCHTRAPSLFFDLGP